MVFAIALLYFILNAETFRNGVRERIQCAFETVSEMSIDTDSTDINIDKCYKVGWHFPIILLYGSYLSGFGSLSAVILMLNGNTLPKMKAPDSTVLVLH